MDKKFDIIVAGGGLVGAAFAVILGGKNVAASLRIGVVEAQRFTRDLQEELFDPRVVALTEASRQMLSSAGIWRGDVASSACPYRAMEIKDSEGTGCITFDCADVHQPDLGHIVENSQLLGALHERIESLGNTEFIYQGIGGVKWGESGSPILMLADGSQLESPLIIAADGANSIVRESCNFSLRTWDYGHTAIVGTIKTALPHDFTARQWFLPEGPLAFLPLQTVAGDCRYASIVWSQNHDHAKTLMALDEQQFCKALTAASEGAMGGVQSISRRFDFPLRQRHVTDYVKSSVVLVGDAAHTIHPLAGQGVNLGFGDINILAEEIVRGIERGLTPSEPSILSRYQRRRKPINMTMMAAMEGLKRGFAESSPLVRLVRNEGMNRLNQVLPLKKQLIRRAMGF